MFSFSGIAGGTVVEMSGPDPPPAIVKCPTCNADVDTTHAYAHVSGLPPTFEALRAAYKSFVPTWEYQRQSFEAVAHEVIEDPARGLAWLEQELNTPDGMVWYRQRLFYRSCVAFYRSFQLLLAFLVLDRRAFASWASVSGYYSRFFFIQALLNLMLTTWLELDHVAIVFDGTSVRCHRQKDLSVRLKKARSHEVWWALMEAVKTPHDFPVEEMGFVLSRLAFNPNDRNNTNYSFEYLGGGFIELDWFDSGAKQLISHFTPVRRSDRDFTNIERFFEATDPENADFGNFYGDTDVQSLWTSIAGYLKLLRALEFEQKFVLTENLVALSELHLSGDYSRVRAGLAQAISDILQDGYDPQVVEDLRAFWRF